MFDVLNLFVGCLQGFAKSKKVLKVPHTNKMVTLPAGYIPKHTFAEDKQKQPNSLVSVGKNWNNYLS